MSIIEYICNLLSLLCQTEFSCTIPDMGRPKGPTYKKAIALRLEDDLWDVIEKMAREEDRPLGSMARVLLREAIEARNKKNPRKPSKE